MDSDVKRRPESQENPDLAPPPAADTSKPHPFFLPSTTGAQGCCSHPRWMVSIIRSRAPPVHFLATVARADDQYAGSAARICCSGAGGRRLVIMAAADVLFTRRREAKRQQRGLRLGFNLFLFLMHLSLLSSSSPHLLVVSVPQSHAHSHSWFCDFQKGGAVKGTFQGHMSEGESQPGWMQNNIRSLPDLMMGFSREAISVQDQHTVGLLVLEFSSQHRQKPHESICVHEVHTGLQSPDK